MVERIKLKTEQQIKEEIAVIDKRIEEAEIGYKQHPSEPYWTQRLIDLDLRRAILLWVLN